MNSINRTIVVGGGNDLAMRQAISKASEDATSAKIAFTTRAAMIAAMPEIESVDAGRVIYAGGLAYQRDPSASAIPDLPGWKPSGDVTPQHFGAVGDGVADDTDAIRAAENWANPRSMPVVFRGSYLSSQNLLGATQRFGGGQIVTPARTETALDGDVFRYQPGTDRSVRLTRNRSDLSAQEGYYILQQYSSAAEYTLRGFAANIRRSGGGGRVVGFQCNGYNEGDGDGTVFGAAFEAWTGNATQAGVGKSTLIGIEPSVLSQTHDNPKQKIGVDVVFKNRPDGESDVLFGSAGENRFNQNSTALRISNGFNSVRPASGAFNGWAFGVRFTSNSLDESIDGKAVGFDISDVNPSILRAAMRMSSGQWVVLGSASGDRDIGFRHVQTDGPSRIEFSRDTNTDPVTRCWIDLSLQGPQGTILANQGLSNVAYAGSAAALPGQPVTYLNIRLDGVIYRVPAFANSSGG